MNSRHLSILPDDSAGDSTADSHTTDLGGGLASYRARYQAFLNQQSQRSLRRNGPGPLSRAISGLISFVIFVALFLAILTLFGFGLSRLGANIVVVNGEVLASGEKAATVADASPTPLRKKNSGKK